MFVSTVPHIEPSKHGVSPRVLHVLLPFTSPQRPSQKLGLLLLPHLSRVCCNCYTLLHSTTLSAATIYYEMFTFIFRSSNPTSTLFAQIPTTINWWIWRLTIFTQRRVADNFQRMYKLPEILDSSTISISQSPKKRPPSSPLANYRQSVLIPELMEFRNGTPTLSSTSPLLSTFNHEQRNYEYNTEKETQDPAS